MLVLLKTSPPGFAKTTLYWLTGFFSIVAVIAIMSPLMSFTWDRGYCFMMIFSILAVLVTGFVTQLDVVSGPQTWRFIAFASVVSCLLILLPFLIKGTTFSGFLWMTILQHKDLARNWYFPLPVGTGVVIYSTASLGLSFLWVWSRRDAGMHEKISFFLQIVKGTVGLLALTAASVGGNPIPIRVPLLEAITPLVWLVVVTPRTQNSRSMPFARISLSLLAVYVSMYAFPVAGAQVSFAVAVLLVASSLFIHDSWVALAPNLNAVLNPSFRKALPAGLLILLGILYARRLTLDYAGYKRLSSLDLPGAERVRLELKDKETYHFLVDHLDARCDTFFSMPGILSLYFSTKQEPPTLLLAGEWMNLFNARQQQTVVDALSRYKHPCIVYNPRLVEFWRRGQDLTRSPLARYIKERFTSIGERKGYYVMVPKIALRPVSPRT